MKLLFALALLTLSTSSHAVINQFGHITWDTETDFIINSLHNKSYAAFDSIYGLTTQQVLDLTAPGQIYENYHIADSNDAFDFFNAALDTNYINDPLVLNVFSGNITNGSYVDNMFGQSHRSGYDYIFYYGDSEQDALGLIELKANSQSFQIHDRVSYTTFKDSMWSAASSSPDASSPWLLVSNVSSVPEPKAAYQLAIGLGLIPTVKRKLA